MDLTNPTHVFFLSVAVTAVCVIVGVSIFCIREHKEEEDRNQPSESASAANVPSLVSLASSAAPAGVPVSAHARPLLGPAAFGAPLIRAPQPKGYAPVAASPPWYRRKGTRRWILVGVVVALAASASTLGYVVVMEGIKTPGVHGYEWTERYGTMVSCAGKSMMSTRMRYMGHGKYIPVIRFANDSEAYAMWDFPHIGYNTALFCMNDTPHLIGSANVELHINLLEDRPETGRIYVVNLETGEQFTAQVPMETCIDEMFEECGLDSKFSMVEWNNHWIAYIRANPVVGGGGRHVQMMRSYDECRTWTPFNIVEIDGIVPQKGVDIYFFDVYKINTTHLGARYPAVFPWESGVFESVSSDAVHWSRPVQVRHSRAFGERTTLHPVGAAHSLRINLHMQAEQVGLYRMTPNGTLLLDNSFATLHTHFPRLRM